MLIDKSLINSAQFLEVAVSYLSFSTRTTLEMSLGALPDLCRNFLPDSLWRGIYLMLLLDEKSITRAY